MTKAVCEKDINLLVDDKFRVHEWLNMETMASEYGVQVKRGNRFVHIVTLPAHLPVWSLVLFKTKEEAKAKLVEYQLNTK